MEVLSVSILVSRSYNTRLIPVPTTNFLSIVHAFVIGLEDYSTDQRGDIGSWIRVVSLASLGQILSDASRQASVPGELIDTVVGGVMKQGMEKLEPVRAEAARTLFVLRRHGWIWESMGCMSTDQLLR